MSQHHFTIYYDTQDMKWHYQEREADSIYFPETDEWGFPDTNSADPVKAQVGVVDETATQLAKGAVRLLNQLAEMSK